MIRTAQELSAALAKCQGGEVIDEGLEIDGRVSLSNLSFAKPVTIRGGRIAQSAPLSSMYDAIVRLTDVTGLALEQLVIAGQPHGADVYRGQGLSIQGGQNIAVQRCQLRELWGGITARGPKGVVIDRNDLHYIRTDGFIGQDLVDVSIAANWFKHWFTQGDPTKDGDHGDAIQLHSNNRALDDCDGILIRDNLMDFRPSERVQGIWPEDARFGGHRRVMIENNLLISTLWNAISTSGCLDAVLRGNKILTIEGGPYTPWIRTDGRPTRMIDNIAPGYKLSAPGEFPPAGNAQHGPVSQSVIDAARDGWMKGHRPAASPAPAPSPSPAPAPKPTKPELRRLAAETRTLVNEAENTLGRALVRLGKLDGAIAAMPD